VLFKKTKIIATLGPATSNPEAIEKLVQAGINAVRLNFSHDTHAIHRKNILAVRALEEKFQRSIAVIQDLQGPKIRLGDLNQEPVILKVGRKVTFCFQKEQQDDAIPIQTNIFPFVKKGEALLIDDGRIQLQVETTEKAKVTCIVKRGGTITSHKGVNLPDTHLPNISLTPKDKADLLLGLKEKVDYVALSFVQDKKDVEKLRNIIMSFGHQAKIIAKIETASAVKNLEEIVRTSDGVMVARGDLAVELGPEEVPIIQRNIIKLAREHNKIVIVATQMLESMIYSPQPTRAETSDVASAVLDETDAVMLSAETATGAYPFESVMMMDKIIKRVESFQTEMHKEYKTTTFTTIDDQTTAIAAAAALLSYQLKAKILMASTVSGKTARQLSSYRPHVPIFAVTDNYLVYQQLSLVWGVTAFLLKNINSPQEYAQVLAILEKMHYIAKGEKVVLVTGTHPGTAGQTNVIYVTMIGENNQ
jgi:pyruvate kinase